MKVALAFALTISSLSSFAQDSRLEVLNCFSRTYDPIHLMRFPGQLVRKINFSLFKDINYGGLYGTVEASAKTRTEWLNVINGGGCRWITKLKLSCGMDMDGGRYTVELTPDRNFATLTVTDYLVLLTENQAGRIDLEKGILNGVYVMKVAPTEYCKNLY